jgi:hypothetical protein
LADGESVIGRNLADLTIMRESVDEDKNADRKITASTEVGSRTTAVCTVVVESKGS